MSERGMMEWCEEEDDPDLRKDFPLLLRRQIDANAERFQQIEASAVAARGAVPMFCDCSSCRSHNERGERGRIDRPLAAATGAAGIDGTAGKINGDHLRT